MAVVLPEKSAFAVTSGLHSGCARIITSGYCLRTTSTSSGVNNSCTSQRPCHAIIVCSTVVSSPLAARAPLRSTDGTMTWRPVSRATLRARNSSGRKITVSDLQRFDDCGRIARGAADVALGLHVGIGVDVRDDRHARIGLAQGTHVGRRDALRQRAAAFLRRQQHRLGRVEYLRRLGHEAHAAKHDDRLVGLGGTTAEFERITPEVRHRMEQRGFHVVVPEDHGVPLHLEAEHFGSDLRLEEQFGVRQDVPQARLQVAVDILGGLQGQAPLRLPVAACAAILADRGGDGASRPRRGRSPAAPADATL